MPYKASDQHILGLVARFKPHQTAIYRFINIRNTKIFEQIGRSTSRLGILGCGKEWTTNGLGGLLRLQWGYWRVWVVDLVSEFLYT